MMSLAFVLLVLWPQAPGLSGASATTRDAQQAIARGNEARLERGWRAALTRNAADRSALLGLATIARLRYQYEVADSLYAGVLQHRSTVGDSYTAAARLGMAHWRSLGTDIRRADSLFTLAHAEAMTVGDTRIAFDALMALARIRGRTAGPRAGLQLVQDAARLLRHATAEDSAQVRCAEGGHMDQLGDTAGATRVAEGTRIADRAGELRAAGNCYLLAAQINERRGFTGAAAGSAAHAVTLFERARYPLGIALASQWLGYARFRRGYFTHARADLKRAVALARATRFESVEAWAHSGLASLFFALGEVSLARDHAARAATLHSAHGDLWGLAVARNFQGRALEAQGRDADARAKHLEAVAAYRRAGLGHNSVEALRSVVLLDLRSGALDSAKRLLDEATRLARSSGNAGWLAERPVHESRLAMLRGDLHVADSLLYTARVRYDWRSNSTSILSIPFALLEAQLALRRQEISVAESAVTYIAEAISQWRRQLQDADLRAGIAQLNQSWGTLSDVYPDLVERLVAAGRLATAFRFIERVRARELTESMLRVIADTADSLAALRQLRRISADVAAAEIGDTRERLRRDEALVSLTLGTSGAASTAIIVTRDTNFAVSLAPRAVLIPLIERYQRVAASGTEPLATGRQLGAALITPIARALPAHITALLISPDGDLFRVPFDALRMADDRHVVERFTVSLVPSATAAVVLRLAPDSFKASGLVAVGDPAFASPRRSTPRLSGGAPLLRSADPARFPGIPLVRLPRSADEARRVAQYGVRSTVWIRANASESAVQTADWSGVAVAHFATHALVDREGQARSALAFAPSERDDGFLTTSEIVSLRFNGALVVLSACQTLGGQILGGEGLRGLAAPFFEAGARAIVATHWSIGDRSVLPFIDRFYAAMASGETAGDALRQAKLAAIRDGARISDWAAFTIIGDATMRPPLRPRRLSPIDWLRDLVQPMRDTTGT